MTLLFIDSLLQPMGIFVQKNCYIVRIRCNVLYVILPTRKNVIIMLYMSKKCYSIA